MPHAVAVAVGVLAVGTAVVAVVRQRWALTGLAVGLAGLSALANGVDRPALGDGVNAVVFVAAMVLVAAGAERSGLLAALAGGLVRRVGGHLRLLLATFVGGVAVTTFLNLDTTAVLFTPLALSIAVAAGADVVPFALAALAAANFGSMLLPTSNLTNLVLWRHSGSSFLAFARSLLAVAVVSCAVVAGALVVVTVVRSRRAPVAMASSASALANGMAPGARAGRLAPDVGSDCAPDVGSDVGPGVTDSRLAGVSGVAIAALVVAFTVGVPVAVGAVVAAAAVLAVRRSLWGERLPMVLAVAVLALFAAAGSLRVSVDVAARVSSWSAAGLASGGMLLANVGSNLASVLLLEPVATTAALRRGLLIGVNLGAGLTPIGSLATILWRDALRRREADVSWSTFAAFSCPLSIMLVATTLLVAR